MLFLRHLCFKQVIFQAYLVFFSCNHSFFSLTFKSKCNQNRGFGVKSVTITLDFYLVIGFRTQGGVTKIEGVTKIGGTKIEVWLYKRSIAVKLSLYPKYSDILLYPAEIFCTNLTIVISGVVSLYIPIVFSLHHNHI